jgi:tetratricopeptide (TPR) repeat protein
MLLLSGALITRVLNSQSMSAPGGTCIELNRLIAKEVADGQLEQADRTISAALANGPSPLTPQCAGLILSQLAKAMLMSGRLRQAEASALAALDYFAKSLPPEDPAYLEPLYALATARFEQGMIGKAREAFQRMQAVRADSPRARVVIHTMGGDLLQMKGALKEAEAEYLQALSATADTWNENTVTPLRSSPNWHRCILRRGGFRKL